MELEVPVVLSIQTVVEPTIALATVQESETFDFEGSELQNVILSWWRSRLWWLCCEFQPLLWRKEW